MTSLHSRSPLYTSAEVTPATQEVEAAPSLVHTEVYEGELNPPPRTSNIGGEADNIMAEVETSVMRDQDLDRGGDPSPVHEERLDTS